MILHLRPRAPNNRSGALSPTLAPPCARACKVWVFLDRRRRTKSWRRRLALLSPSPLTSIDSGSTPPGTPRYSARRLRLARAAAQSSKGPDSAPSWPNYGTTAASDARELAPLGCCGQEVIRRWLMVMTSLGCLVLPCCVDGALRRTLFPPPPEAVTSTWRWFSRTSAAARRPTQHTRRTLSPSARWAEAIWCGWLPRPMMGLLIRAAKASLTTSARPWASVKGPAGAAVASAARLSLHFNDARELVTDRGRVLRLDVDSPAVVKREIAKAVRRWRWRRIELKHPHLDSNGEGRGACIAPVRRLLRATGSTVLWNAAHRAALRSAIVNTQWPQQRLADAGIVDDARCQTCMAQALMIEAHEVAAGTLIHRVSECPVTSGTHDAVFAPLASMRGAFAALALATIRITSNHTDAGLAIERFAHEAYALPREAAGSFPRALGDLVTNAPARAWKAARDTLRVGSWSTSTFTRAQCDLLYCPRGRHL